MSEGFEGLDAVFSSVLLASRDAAILALAIGLILVAFGRKIPPAWRHGLWLLVVVRLLLPSLPGGALSWQRLLPAPSPAIVERASAEPQPLSRGPSSPLPEPAGEIPPPTLIPGATTQAQAEPGRTLTAPAAESVRLDWGMASALAWLVGTVCYLGLLFTLDFRFRRRVRLLTEHEASGVEKARNLLDRLYLEQRCRRQGLRITRAVPVPAISGLLRPEILLPPATLERLDESELRLVLLHELAHLRRRDLWLNWLLALLQAVHWFNPVVWWAFHRVRVEAECAADAWVLHRCGDETPSQYGEALLRLLEAGNPARRIAIPGVVGVFESPRDLRSRIQTIACFSRKRNRLAAVGSAALIVGLAAAGLTQAPVEKEEEAPSAAEAGESPLPEAIDSPLTRVSDVEITVVDEAGDPVEGAEVIVTAGNDYLAQVLTPIALHGRTGVGGVLADRTAPVREDADFGIFYVMAFKEGFAGFTWLQPTIDRATGKIDFEKGTLRCEVKLTPAETVKATIHRPDGSPAVGLRVWVDGIGLPPTNPPRLPGDLWQAVTDESGVVELRGLPKGARIHLGHDQEEWAAFPGYHHILIDGLTASEEARTLTLAPAASVSGRVLSSSGRGVPNIIVEIRDHHPYVNAHHGFAISDPDGYYQLNSLPEGRYQVFAAGRAGHRRNFWVLTGGGSLELKAGEQVADQDFEFKRGGRLVSRLVDEATGDLITESWGRVGLAGTVKGIYHSGLTPEGYHENREKYEGEIRVGEVTYLNIPFKKRSSDDRISGVVLDPAGNPVSGAKVKCPTIQAAFLDRMITETDEAGQFAFDLAPDTKEVSLIAWEGERISDPGIRYAPGTEVTVQLEENPFGTVVGRVVDGNGIALPQARFYSTGEELPGITDRAVDTDAEGRFRIAVLPKDIVTFWISKDGYTKVARQGEIEAGEEIDLGDIQLEAATASVAGRVVFGNGQTASRSRLRIDGENQPELRNLVTDTEGRFRIQGVAEGWLWVGAYDHLDEGQQSGRSRVRSGSEDVRIVLEPTPERRDGTAVDFVGKPAPPLNADHWYHVSNPEAEHEGKIRMIRFIGKDRPLIYFSRTVKLIQELQDEFAGKGVEFLLVHGPWPKEEVEEILAADHPDMTVPLAIESEKDAMSDAFGVKSWLTVVIDRDGKVVFQDPRGSGSKAAVQKLLDAENPASPPEPR